MLLYSSFLAQIQNKIKTKNIWFPLVWLHRSDSELIIRKISANRLHTHWLHWGTWSSRELSWSSTPRRLGSRLAGRRTSCWACRRRRGCQSKHMWVNTMYSQGESIWHIDKPGLVGSPRSSCRIPSVRPSTPIGCPCQRSSSPLRFEPGKEVK